MSLRAQIQEAVKTGLLALDDLPETATYGGISTSVYDPATGVIVQKKTGSVSVPMLFTSFSFMEIDNVSVFADDRKAIIAAVDLVVAPTHNDSITRADGSVWNVIGIKIDPAGAAWVIQIRRP